MSHDSCSITSCFVGLLAFHHDHRLAMSLDPKASFKLRAQEVGITDAQLTALEGRGVSTYADFAYCCTYQPGQADDTPLLQFIERALGAAPTAGVAAKFRRLFFESHALSLQDLKSRLDRTDASEARAVPLPERMERLRQVKQRLTGITFTPVTEPSHSLIDRACQQMEDGVVSYIELSKWTSRADETLATKTDTSLTLDNQGKLRLAKKARTEEVSLSGDHQLRTAFLRRSLAYDMASVATFQALDKWTQKLMEKMAEQPPSGYRYVSVEQVLQADKAIWIRAADQSRSNLANTTAGAKPFDDIFTRLMDHPEVLCYIAPLPHVKAPPVNDPPRPTNPKGGGKGDKGDKGKGKGKITVRDDCTIFLSEGKQICKKYQVGACRAKGVKPGKRCSYGYHLYWKK